MKTEVEALVEAFNVITVNSQPYQATADLKYEGDVSLGLLIPPSDPDFPFDVPLLHLLLLVPHTYPASAPQIMVLNDDIPRGYSYNIEMGFKALTGEHKDPQLADLQCEKSLKGYVTALDANLERFLRMEKKEARVKIVKANANKKKAKQDKKDKKDKKDKSVPDKHTKPDNTKSPKTEAPAPNAYKDEQIRLLKARFSTKTVKEGSTYKITLKLHEAFQVHFDAQEDPVSLTSIHLKMVVPPDYGRDSGRNRVKLEIDFGHPDVLRLLSGLAPQQVKLAVKDLLFNVGRNFDQLAAARPALRLAEYLNFVAANLSKLMGPRADFDCFLLAL